MRICQDCKTDCQSFAECKNTQFKNYAIAESLKLKEKNKLKTVGLPDIKFNGKTKYMEPVNNDNFEKLSFENTTPPWGYRFITITFDPVKFGANFLSQPQVCKNYIFNVLTELEPLFGKFMLIFEYHKSGILHAHISYTVKSAETDEDEALLEHSTLKIRLLYYFSKSLRNKKAIHDRMFNEGGKKYMTKSNIYYYIFKAKSQ